MSYKHACLKSIFVFLCFSTPIITMAAPITYTFNGIASGTIGEVAFNDQSFTTKIYADTSDVEDYGCFGGSCIVFNVGAGSIKIEGQEIGIFLDPIEVVLSHVNPFIGFSQTLYKGILAPAVGNGYPEQLGNYDLKGSVEEINLLSQGFGEDQPDTMNLDIGGLVFTSTYTTTFSAQVVPIPAAAWLFGSALIGLVGVKRKK